MDNKEWLFDDMNGLKEKIRFKDRIEYRVSGELHNPTGPALILYEDDKITDKKYYYKGKEYNFDDWSIKTRSYKIKKIKKNINDKNDN